MAKEIPILEAVGSGAGIVIGGFYSIITNVVFMGIILPLLLGVAYAFMQWNKFRTCAVIMYVGGKKIIRSVQVPLVDISNFSLKVGKTLRTYNLSKVEPMQIKRFWGFQPFYMVSEDTPLGIDFNIDTSNFEVKDDPKVVGSLVEGKFFREAVSTTAQAGRIDILMILLGVAVGMALIFVLGNAGVIPICTGG